MKRIENTHARLVRTLCIQRRKERGCNNTHGRVGTKEAKRSGGGGYTLYIYMPFRSEQGIERKEGKNRREP